MAIFEFVHANEEPAGLLEKLPILMGEPGQTAILEIGLTIGVG